MKYAKGPYNNYNEEEQWIRINEGCLNNCEFCRETKENGYYNNFLDVPEIIRNKVKIMDMNFVWNLHCIDILNEFGNKRVNKKVVYYELICGIDWRLMNQDIANALNDNRFKNIRFAWDHTLKHQIKIKDCLNILLKAGYKAKSLSCFIICDWKISYEDCLKKLDLLKIWNVKFNDCWFDNTTSPNFQCNYWNLEQCKEFRRKCRKHNQMVLFGIDPELK